jgi:alpha-galactosidase
MPKVTMIGAGSMVFARRLMCDTLSFPELSNSTISFMDIDEEKVSLIGRLAQKLVDQESLPAKIEATTDRRRALEGADYVISMFRVGGMDAVRPDIEIPQRYGVDQRVGDTIGPGGVLYGLRHIPLILDICRDMEELCPDALLMNYANPMAILCWAVNAATKVKSVGLCHSVQGTARRLAEYIGVPFEEISYWAAGINHMDWFLRYERNGQDAYPMLREALEDPEIYAKDPVRFEIMRHFGYFVSESSGHASEYMPYFRRTPELIERSSQQSRDFDHFGQRRAVRFEALRQQVESDEPLEFERTHEYCARILHACETNTPYRFSGNVANRGVISNLPEECVVEVPCLADATGIHPCYVGDLPLQCAALNRSNISLQSLTIKAALEGDREAVYHAIALDPLTASVVPLDEIRRMTDELLEASADWLPKLS